VGLRRMVGGGDGLTLAEVPGEGAESEGRMAVWRAPRRSLGQWSAVCVRVCSLACCCEGIRWAGVVVPWGVS
jgi:hypothetical protein